MLHSPFHDLCSTSVQQLAALRAKQLSYIKKAFFEPGKTRCRTQALGNLQTYSKIVLLRRQTKCSSLSPLLTLQASLIRT